MPLVSAALAAGRCAGEDVGMSESADVTAFLDAIASPRRRRDAERLIGLMRRATGAEPEPWRGGILGFGRYHYRYESGREGDAPAAGFAPRSSATVVYLSDGVGAHEAELARLGAHTTGVGCLYLRDLDAVDLEVLEGIVARSFAALTAGDYGKRARDGGA